MSAVPRPVRLVYRDEKGVFRMDGEAVSILQLVKGPIGVVTVCGPAQHGKSYISNRLLGRADGFKVKRTAPWGYTKGLWMWSNPIRKIAADGSDYHMIVIDSEGIESSPEAKEEYLYLAVVLSSVVLYNQIGVINGPIYDTFSIAPKITKLALGGMAASDFAHPFLVWVLRDFCMWMGEATPSGYLEYQLKLVDDPRDLSHVNIVNKIKRSIKDLFPDRHCFTLVRPSIDGSKLWALDKTPVGHLSSDFKKEMAELRGFVSDKLKPKKIGATVMTGPVFVQITRYILDAFNSGKMPSIASIWENVGKTKRRKALESATTANVVDDPPAANTRQRKRKMEQMMSS